MAVHACGTLKISILLFNSVQFGDETDPGASTYKKDYAPGTTMKTGKPKFADAPPNSEVI